MIMLSIDDNDDSEIMTSSHAAQIHLNGDEGKTNFIPARIYIGI